MCLQIQLEIYIGHARNAAVGDTLANILTAAGYNVTKNITLMMLVIKLPI